MLLILSFDQTPQGFTAPNKATVAEKGAQSVLIANVDDKRQITGTFYVNISGEDLSIQLIPLGVTDRYNLKVKFPDLFQITHSSNNWSN